jgi:transcription elongation factor Elf1
MSEYGCPSCATNEFYLVETVRLNADGNVDASVDMGIMKCANCGNRIEVIEGQQPIPMNLRAGTQEVRRSSQLRTSKTSEERGIGDSAGRTNH